MESGRIKSVVANRGFGFIGQPGSGDVFFHARDLDKSLEFGEQLQELRVTFDVVTNDKGKRAFNVKPED